jgi:hypothetical protein
VVEINAFDVVIPARGVGHKTTGQGLNDFVRSSYFTTGM